MLCGNCNSWQRRIDNVSDDYQKGRCFSGKAFRYLSSEEIPPDGFGCIFFEKLSDTRLNWELSKEKNQKIIPDIIFGLSSECGISADNAELIAKKIIAGKIPHVSIEF